MLWGLEVADIADDAFTTIARVGMFRRDRSGKLVRCSSEVIDIVSFEKWFGLPVEDDTIPLKSREEMQHLYGKAEIGKQVQVKSPPRVDTEALSQKKINAAAVRAAARMVVADIKETTRVQRYKESLKPQVKGQKWNLPPLQRWEAPKEVETRRPGIQAGPGISARITVKSWGRWKEDHTKLLTFPSVDPRGPPPPPVWGASTTVPRPRIGSPMHPGKSSSVPSIAGRSSGRSPNKGLARSMSMDTCVLAPGTAPSVGVQGTLVRPFTPLWEVAGI